MEVFLNKFKKLLVDLPFTTVFFNDNLLLVEFPFTTINYYLGGVWEWLFEGAYDLSSFSESNKEFLKCLN